MKKSISIGLLGLGVVGSGVIKLVENHQEHLHHQLGLKVDIKKVLVRDLTKERAVALDPALLTTNPDDVLHDPDIDIIVEVMGGIDEARHHMLEAFQTKKHVVTANKDLIALHGPELQKAASDNNCDLFYEASVAGGIPILRGLSDGLVSDRIEQIMGIVNGTTNYILTKMNTDGISYDEALDEAKELGFAEADPTADVEGLDAARKMAIMARIAFSTNIDLCDVDVEGITNLALDDLQYGKKLGYTMKLIGFADCKHHDVEVNVQPTFIASTHPLAGVKNEYNAVYVNGEAVGETMFYGAGAGSMPTATAVMSDVVQAIKNILLGINRRRYILPQFEKQLTPPEKRFSKYYVRLHAKDEVGTFAAISNLFDELGIGFERILQTPNDEYNIAEIVFVTHQTSLAIFHHAIEKLHALQAVTNIDSSYRVEGDVRV